MLGSDRRDVVRAWMAGLARIVREAFGVTVVGLAVGISGDRGWGISARAETGWG